MNTDRETLNKSPFKLICFFWRLPARQLDEIALLLDSTYTLQMGENASQ